MAMRHCVLNRERALHSVRTGAAMMKFIFWAFLFLLSGRSEAQMPSGNFTSHTDGQTVTSASINITWKGCSNATQSSYQTRINTVNITTTQSSTFPCPDYTIGRNYSASGTVKRSQYPVPQCL
jgi:hypothetical protein